jgi:hypothetical protein
MSRKKNTRTRSVEKSHGHNTHTDILSYILRDVVKSIRIICIRMYNIFYS